MRTRALPGNGLITNERIRVVHPRRRRIARLALVALGATVGSVAGTALVATNVTAPASAALAPCHDSNGRAPGGSVYVVHGHAVGCDVVHGQRLHVTRVPNRATCDDMGGRYAPATRVCWDVDY